MRAGEARAIDLAASPGPRTRRPPRDLRLRRPIHNIALLRLHFIALLHSYVDAYIISRRVGNLVRDRYHGPLILKLFFHPP